MSIKSLAQEMVEYIRTCAEDEIVPSMWDAVSFEKDFRRLAQDAEGVERLEDESE